MPRMARQTYVMHNGELLLKAEDGVLTDAYLSLPHDNQSIFHGFGRDQLGDGVKGIMNHADGKRYDSKSQYERAVRATGCRIVGNDYNGKTFNRQLEGNFNPRNELKQAVQRVMQ